MRSFLLLLLGLPISCAFLPLPSTARRRGALYEMKRPILDQIASALFKLENDRVESSSVIDEQGRNGEPMEWSEGTSVANKFSEIVATNPIGYRFKQWVADIVAGEYDEEIVSATVDDFFSGTTTSLSH